MIQEALILFGVSVFLFIAMIIMVQKERRHGRRLFAHRVRSWLDDRVNACEASLARSWEHFVKYILQLNWYYSIHSVLRTILRLIVAFYTYFENIFERNRKRTKELRAEKRQLHALNHLRQMAEHKANTALTPAEQRRLRKKKLEERH